MSDDHSYWQRFMSFLGRYVHAAELAELEKKHGDLQQTHTGLEKEHANLHLDHMGLEVKAFQLASDHQTLEAQAEQLEENLYRSQARAQSAKEEKMRAERRHSIATKQLEARLSNQKTNLTQKNNLIGHLQANADRSQTLDLLQHRTMALIDEPIIMLSPYNRVIAVSQGFTKIFGYDLSDLQESVADGLTSGVTFDQIVANPETFARLTEVSDIFYPDTGDYHCRIAFEMMIKGTKKTANYNANAFVANQMVATGENKSEPRYHGTFMLFEKESKFFDWARALFHFHPSGNAYLNAPAVVDSSKVEAWIKDLGTRVVEGQTESVEAKPILIDFSNTDGIIEKAPELIANLYRTLAKAEKEGRYAGPNNYVVPKSLRPILNEQGVSWRAMMVPEQKKQIILPGKVAPGYT